MFVFHMILLFALSTLATPTQNSASTPTSNTEPTPYVEIVEERADNVVNPYGYPPLQPIREGLRDQASRMASVDRIHGILDEALRLLTEEETEADIEDREERSRLFYSELGRMTSRRFPMSVGSYQPKH
jgi:hypothetical protein